MVHSEEEKLYLTLTITEEQIDHVDMATMLDRGYNAAQNLVTMIITK